MSAPTESESLQLELTVPEDQTPVRIDSFLAADTRANITRSRAQKLISQGLVAVDGEDIAKSYVVRPGEIVSVVIPPQSSPHLIGEDIDLNIVFEDEHLVVVDKPAGMVTHPAIGNISGTMVNALIYRYGLLSEVAGNFRPGIVHRLDKNTSGLLVVARSDSILVKLQEQLQRREIKRTYLALVWGNMKEDSGVIDLPVGRSRNDRKKMAVLVEGGRAAVSRYQVERRFAAFDLLEVELETGRTHQIRVHFSHLGHPVFGDPDYGGRDKRLKGLFAPERPQAKEMLAELSRQALHARRLQFTHPITKQELSFEAEPPPDIKGVLARLDS